MQFTRRYWTVVALGATVLAWGIVLAEPAVFVGGVLLGAWLLASQYAYVRAVDATVDALSIDLTATPTRLLVDEAGELTMTVTLDRPTPIDLGVRAPIPVGASTDGNPTLAVDLDELRRATDTTTVAWRVAGTVEIGPPTVTAADPYGLFRTAVERGPSTTVVVEPNRPRTVQIGAGGTRIAAALGAHDDDQLGTGSQPAELREYRPGDEARRIDWKATARLGDVHVREFDAETDRKTVLLVDHRSSMAAGPAGETQFDYARQIALGIVDLAEAFDDPLGWYAVGDGGLTQRREPSSSARVYEAARSSLRELAPTEQPSERPEGDTADHPLPSPARARDRADRLAGGDTAFERTLRPYYEASTQYVARIEDDPLFRTAKAHLDRLSGPIWTVVVTDDTHPTELTETVELTRRGDNHVLVVLVPSALFEPGALTDVDETYERYRAFEELRRSLDGRARTTAVEIAPGDRVEAILAGRRRDRSPGAQTG